MKYRRNSDAEIRDLERIWESSRSPADLERLNNARIRHGLPIFHAHQLEFGYNPGLPALAPAAWGARAILERGSGGRTVAGLVTDRQSMVGPQELRESLRDALNGGVLAAMQREIARLSNKGILRSDEAKEFVLYDDPTIRIVGNTNASHGYIYLVAFIKPEGWVPTPAPTISCENCQEEFPLNTEELEACSYCSKSLCENCREGCPHCDEAMCLEPHHPCRNCQNPICSSNACARRRPSKECPRCGDLYCFDCRREIRDCPCAEEICDECGDSYEECKVCGETFCSCEPCSCATCKTCGDTYDECGDCGTEYCSCEPCPCQKDEESEEEPGESNRYRYNPDDDDLDSDDEDDFELGGWAVVHDSGDLVADGFESEASAREWLKMAADGGMLNDELGAYHVTEVED